MYPKMKTGSFHMLSTHKTVKCISASQKNSRKAENTCADSVDVIIVNCFTECEVTFEGVSALGRIFSLAVNADISN